MRRTTGAARTARAKSTRRGATAKRSEKAKRGGRKASGKTTTDHDFIRNWVEERGGTPSTVSRTTSSRSAAGILRIDFPGYSGRGSLKPVSWDDWFEQFEQRGLAFLYQDKTADGKKSRFCKMIAR